MFQCANAGAFPMSAEIYTQSQTQDPKTGMMVNTWTKESTISCSAVPGMSRTSLGQGSFLKTDVVNQLTDFVKLRTSSSIPLSKRISNIKDASGKAVWIESDDRSGKSQATIFEVRGNGPVIGNDGSVICYEMILERVDVQ